MKPKIPIKLSMLDEELLSEGVTLLEADFKSVTSRDVPFHLATFSVEPDTVSFVDQHEVSETWFVIAGNAKVCSGTSEQAITRNDIVYIEPNVPHKIINDDQAETLRVLSVWWN